MAEPRGAAIPWTPYEKARQRRIRQIAQIEAAGLSAVGMSAVRRAALCRLLSEPAQRERRARQAHVKRLHDARKREAMPAWADRDAIQAIYTEARRMTEETGIPHEVDHIEPLLGKGASGLHVDYNLRVVPRAVNRRKGNRRCVLASAT